MEEETIPERFIILERATLNNVEKVTIQDDRISLDEMKKIAIDLFKEIKGK